MLYRRHQKEAKQLSDHCHLAKMLQHLWFKAIVICCCIASTLDFRLDLKQRMVKPLRLWLKVIVYGQPYFCVCIVPWSLWNSWEISDSHLTNPVVRSANIVTILVRIGLFFTFVRGIYQRNRKLEKWLRRALTMQKAYFDGLPERETTGRSISHRKWLYLTSLITCLPNEARTLLYFMVTIQHFFMLTHGACCWCVFYENAFPSCITNWVWRSVVSRQAESITYCTVFTET